MMKEIEKGKDLLSQWEEDKCISIKEGNGQYQGTNDWIGEMWERMLCTERGEI